MLNYQLLEFKAVRPVPSPWRSFGGLSHPKLKRETL